MTFIKRYMMYLINASVKRNSCRLISRGVADGEVALTMSKQPFASALRVAWLSVGSPGFSARTLVQSVTLPITVRK